MLISINKGALGCDLCGKMLERKFTYYTARVVKIDVDVSQKQTIRSDTDMDIEFCEECRQKIRAEILKNIEQLKQLKKERT